MDLTIYTACFEIRVPSSTAYMKIYEVFFIILHSLKFNNVSFYETIFDFKFLPFSCRAAKFSAPFTF